MKFNDLSIREKAAVIKLGIGGGLHTLLDIQLLYDGLDGPDDPPIVLKVNNSKANFVLRLKDANRAYIRDWENNNNIATHKLSWAEDDNDAIVYPNVLEVNGKLIDYTRPPYDTWAGYENAIRTGDTVRMTPQEAEWFTTHYKDYYPGFNEYRSGGPINNLKKKFIGYKINKATNDLGIIELRNRLYNNIDPYDYYGNALHDFNKAVKNEKAGRIIREDKELAKEYNLTNHQINVADEIFAQYLLIPNEKRHTNLRLRKSKYAPTKSKSNSKNVYYSLPLENKDIQNLISERFSSDYELPSLFNREVKEIPNSINIGLNKLSYVLGNYNLGTHTVGRGYDDKGEYVSYYDLWDLNPVEWDGGEDLSYGIGKPIEFYDRIYLDEYYDIGDKGNHSTYLPEIIITPNEYKKGGSIHIKPENRGKFTATKKRTGKTTEELTHSKNPLTRKRAIFALNARKWHKHAYGGPGDGLDTYMTPKQIDNARYIWNYITSQGISPRNAAVLMGNAMKESSLNPQAKNPNSSAYGYLLMIDALRKKADKYIRENNLDKDLGLFNYYNYLIQNNIDDYMKEYNRVYNEMNRRQLVYNSNPTDKNKTILQEYIDYYDKTYGERASLNRLFPVSDLKDAYNNPKSTVKELTPLFEETFMRAGSGAEHDKRIKYAYDFLDYFAPDERAYELMRNDPLNYNNGQYILEDGKYNYYKGGLLKK